MIFSDYRDKGLTYAWIARKAGVNVSQVSRIARGLQWPTRRVAHQIQQAMPPTFSWSEWLAKHGPGGVEDGRDGSG